MSVRPLVVLGIDAGDPRALLEWSRAGRLPTLAGLFGRGSWARTAGPELISEHGVWMSLLSGISRSEHGYYYFRQLRPGTYDLVPVTGSEIDAPPFWTRLPERKLALLDIPDTDPIPGLRGIQLCHWATHNNWDPDHFVTASLPPDVLTDVSRRFAPRLVTREVHDARRAEDRQIHRALLDRVRVKGAMCRHLLGNDRFDLAVTVFAEAHAANHQFWRYGPFIPEAERVPDEELSSATQDVYEAVDRELGALLTILPEDANVVVLSSVGMADDFPTTGLIEGCMRQLGYQATPSANGTSRGPVDLLRRIVPRRARVALGERLLSREAREGRLAEEFRRSTQWGRTTAFAIPSAYTSFVRVNLRGREPQGIVAPGDEYFDVLDRIEEDLRRLTDPQTGDSVVQRTARTVDLFGGEPPASLPDLFVEWITGRYLSAVHHPRGEISQSRPDFFRRSDHSSEGLLLAAGPDVPAAGERPPLEVLDVAPTLLRMMGETALSDELAGAPRADFLAG